MTAPPPLAYIYARCVTSNPALLDLRLSACTEYLAEQGWHGAGRFVDFGDDALTKGPRPEFDAMLRAMREAAGRERVCLVYDWGRLSHDLDHRQKFTDAVLATGAWLTTVGGQTVRAGAVPDGRLTAGPVIV